MRIFPTCVTEKAAGYVTALRLNAVLKYQLKQYPNHPFGGFADMRISISI
jgi:hypothetical protein